MLRIRRHDNKVNNMSIELHRTLLGVHSQPIYSVCKINNCIATSGRDKKIIVWK